MGPQHRSTALRTRGLVLGTATVFLATAAAWSQCSIQDLDGAAPQGFDSPPSALALDGRFAAVGQHVSTLVPGHVLVYRRAGGRYELMANLHTPNPEVTGDDVFGAELAISGDVLAVGAERLNTGCGIGVVHMYRYDGQTWTPEQILLPPTCATRNFGSSLALEGDVLLVGAPNTQHADGPSETGAAYVYRFDGSRWSLEATLVDPQAEEFANLGSSVALSGQTALIGSPGSDDTAFNDGAALVFVEQDRRWTFRQRLLPTDPDVNEGFGSHVALHGDVAAIGAPNCCSPPSGVGSVYMLRFDGRMWVHEQQIEHPPSVGFFGDPTLAADGQTLLISGGFPTIYLHRYDDGAWISTGEIGILGAYAVSVAAVGDVAMLGIHYPDNTAAVQLIGGLGPLDCNGNGQGDACDIASGFSADANDDGVPDECQAAPDLTGDGVVDGADLGLLLTAWGECPAGEVGCIADLNNDGIVDGADLGILLAAWGRFPALTCPGAGDCCTAHGQPGCEQAACCETVCEGDPYCCLTAWDVLCASSAVGACGCATPAVCGQASEDCCFPHDSPGCGDADCCNAVCAVDIFCCEQAWDFICHTEALQFCDCPEPPECEECGDFSCGDCCDATGQPGCNDAACCELVCNEIDPFCCEVAWDGVCAATAASACGICGP